MPRLLSACCLLSFAALLSCGAPSVPMSTNVVFSYGTPGSLTSFAMHSVYLYPGSTQTRLVFSENSDGSTSCVGGSKMVMTVTVFDQGRSPRGPGSYTLSSGDGQNKPLQGYQIDAVQYQPSKTGTECAPSGFNAQVDTGTLDFTSLDYWGATGSFNLSRAPSTGSTFIAEIKGTFSAPGKGTSLTFQ